MISGKVNKFLEIEIPLRVYSENGAEYDLTAIIDTGFTGHLAMPDDLVALLDLPVQMKAKLILGDGSQVESGVYEANVEWFDRTIAVPVHSTGGDGSGILVGVRPLRGTKLEAEFEFDGNVAISRRQSSSHAEA